MKFYEVRRTIAAPASIVWGIITNAKLLARSDLGITKLEGTIELGAKLKLYSEVSPKRAFALNVTNLTPNCLMIWTGGMPLGLFKGVRKFSLTEAGSKTELHISEQFSGPLFGPICKSMPNLQPSFDKLANGIKRLAEERTS